jgi:predicted nucleic acid-binding protein
VSFLLDTNIVSEWVKPRPAVAVMNWLADVDEDQVFLSVVTIAELKHGIERLPAGRRRQRLDEWLRLDVSARFEGRLIPIDEQVALRWGLIVAARETRGRPIGSMDALIAATAATHGLTLVTRNAPDFEASVPAVFDPWRS